MTKTLEEELAEQRKKESESDLIEDFELSSGRCLDCGSRGTYFRRYLRHRATGEEWSYNYQDCACRREARAQARSQA